MSAHTPQRNAMLAVMYIMHEGHLWLDLHDKTVGRQARV